MPMINTIQRALERHMNGTKRKKLNAFWACVVKKGERKGHMVLSIFMIRRTLLIIHVPKGYFQLVLGRDRVCVCLVNQVLQHSLQLGAW